MLAVDHKPLIPILGTKDLQSIPNPRIANQRVKLLPYDFIPVHIPGKTNVVPDTLSRAAVRTETAGGEVELPQQTAKDDSEEGRQLIPIQDVLQVRPAYSETYGPPDWVARPPGPGVQLLAAEEADGDEAEELVLGVAWSQVAATQEQEKEVAASHGLSGVRAVTWEILKEESGMDKECQALCRLITDGMPEEVGEWPAEVKQYYPHRKALLVVDGVVMYGDRLVIPPTLRPQVLEILHAGHSGASTMYNKAMEAVFWPGMSGDIKETRLRCRECVYRAPSQPAMPPHKPVVPDYPFSHLCADFFFVDGSYLALCDRYSGWLSIHRFKKDDTKSVIATLQKHFETYGIAKEISTDGQRTLCSAEMEEFLARWGVRHRISSAYHPQSNKRAELAVKHAKRIITGNLGPRGEVETDRLTRALLEHRNTPDPQTGLSPAQVVFGRQLRSCLPAMESKLLVRGEWRLDAEKRAEAFAKRQSQMQERLEWGARQLGTLEVGQEVAVQDPPAGGKPGRWSKSGTVVEVLGHDAYMVRIHGSRSVTKRNRSQLRKIIPFIPEERLVPVTNPKVKEVVKSTVTESAERFVAIQPPRKWQRLSPIPHRQAPVGLPGEDIVGKMKDSEAAQTA